MRSTRRILGLNAKGQLIFRSGEKIFTGKTVAPRWTWHHATLVRNSDTARIYLDGKLQIEAKITAPLPVQSLFLGGRHDNQANWEGRLDEAAVFERALTIEEVRALSY